MNSAIDLISRKPVALSLLALGGLAALPAQAGTEALGPCLQAVAALKPGDFVKVEYLQITEKGVPTFEIEVRGDDGVAWELMCNAETAAIYELEREADSPDDKLFGKNKKVSEKDAVAKVTEIYPGSVQEVEYEIESDGSPSYEIDVAEGKGPEYKVEVDAVSGDIIEVNVEAWQIGTEPKESGKGTEQGSN